MTKRTHDFSIYLLKPGVDAETALDDEHELTRITASNLPPNSQLFLLEGEADVWWPAYLGIDKSLRRNRLGAVLFVTAASRLFAVTFGRVSSQLCDESYEREFGLRVTLNSLDELKLSATDTLSPAGGRQRRTQLPIEADLTVLDFDQNSDVLKRLSGKVREEFKSIFSSVSGTDCVRVRSNIAAPKLGELCSALLKLSRLNDYKKRFPQIGKIARVTDPATVRKLDNKLVAAVNGRSALLNLTVPDLTTYPHGANAKFVGGGRRAASFSDVFVEPYFEFLDSLDQNGVVNIETLRRAHKLQLESDQGTQKYPLYRCLVFDTSLKPAGPMYHLLDGQWYRVAKDYVIDLQKELDLAWSVSELPAYSHGSEGAFNQHVAAEDKQFICLDTSSMSPVRKHRVEPCDLLSIDGHWLRLWHVKRSTLSFMLSHLFSQGANSIHLLKQEPSAVENLRALVKARAQSGQGPFLTAIDGGLFEVRFVIVTHKNPMAKAANLPLFSKITLRRTAKELRAYGVRTRFEFVEDQSPKATKKAKVKRVHAL